METKVIGNKIAEARKKMDISQAQLAEQLFISAQAVGKWERGESLPDIIMLNRFAKLVGVDLNYFSADFSSTVNETTISSTTDEPEELPAKNNKPSWNMSRSNWIDADFSGLKNLEDKFSESNMQGCQFNGSDLSGLTLKSNNVNGCDFTGSDLSKSQIQSSNLVKDIFTECMLKEAHFLRAHIESCDFTGTDLTAAHFSRAYLHKCNFSGANFTSTEFKWTGISGVSRAKDPEENIIINAVWKGTSFVSCHLSDLVFNGPMEDCYFERCQFTRVTFLEVQFSHTFFKNNDNLRRSKFIDCTVDRMTYEFLKQGKADLSGVSVLED